MKLVFSDSAGTFFRAGESVAVVSWLNRIIISVINVVPAFVELLTEGVESGASREVII